MLTENSPPGATWDADTAVQQLYATHWRHVVRLSVLLVRDLGTAEEVVEDSFVALHDRWSHLCDPEQAFAYLRQKVVDRSRSVLQHRGVETRRATLPAVAGPADESALAHAPRDVVLDVLQRLPGRQREVVALRYYLNLSEHNIAQTLGISQGAVKRHASRGLTAMKSTVCPLREDPS